MRSIIYCRISLDSTGEQLGVQRQEAECRNLCTSRDYQVTRVITDNSVSATYGTRSGYSELIKAIKSGGVDVVVVYRLDRLLRKLTELEELITLTEQTGVQIVTVQGDLDLSNSTGRLIGRILASVARSEVEVKSERHKAANAQKASQGKPHHGGRRPYGYESDHITIKKDEANALREMGQMLLSGHGYKDIAYHLNEKGIPTTQGKLWYPITVRNLLKKKRYGGIREYNGTEYPAIWEPVFDPETWERLQLTVKLKESTKPLGKKYLLTGFVYCGNCGQQLNGQMKRDNPKRPLRRTYNCRTQGDTQKAGGCGGVVRNADALEHFIRECIIYRLNSPDLAELLGKKDDTELKALLEHRKLLSDRIAELVDDYASGLLDRSQFARAKVKAENELSTISDQINAQNGLNVSLQPNQTVKDAWLANGDEWKRSLISLLIKSITVNVGKTKPYYDIDGVRARFDPALIEISWIA